MARVALLLPERARFGGQRLSPDLAAALGRGRVEQEGTGRRAQLARHVDMPGGPWPIAALTRQADAGDAAGAAWLRADPAWLRPDLNGVRLMAHGEGLQLAREDCDALLPALKPLFGDAGFALDAPVPSRWYLRLSPGARLPGFPEPGDVLGDDLFEHLDDGPESRRWRALASEAQVLLHNHSWNARRAERGQPPVNALWFWGAGLLPDVDGRMHSLHAVIHADEPTLHALAAAAAIAEPLPPRLPRAEDDRAFDLTACRDLRLLEHDWLRPALDALHDGDLALLELDAADGWRLELAPRDRFRFWRRPLPHWNA